MLGFRMVGASSDPPDSMTSTLAPDADNSAARTEPAAPAPTTMKSYRLWSLASLFILNSQGLDSGFSDSRLESLEDLPGVRAQRLFSRDRCGTVRSHC